MVELGDGWHLRGGTDESQMPGQAVGAEGELARAVRTSELKVAPETLSRASSVRVRRYIAQPVPVSPQHRRKRRIPGGVERPGRQLQGTVGPRTGARENGGNARGREVAVGVSAVEGGRMLRECVEIGCGRARSAVERHVLRRERIDRQQK